MNEPLSVESPRSGITDRTPLPSHPKKSNLRFIPTLLRKNWLLKKKHPVALLMEIITPMLFILIMDIIRSTSSNSTVPGGFTQGSMGSNLFTPNGGSSLITPDPTPKFAVQETTLSGLLLHLGAMSFTYAREMKTFTDPNITVCRNALLTGGRVSLNASSQYALPDKCEDRVSPFKIAIVPDDTFTRNYFFEIMKQWYPTVVLNGSASSSLVIPSFEDSTIFFTDEDALEEYIKSGDYATTGETPSIFGAIVFDKYPTAADSIGRASPIEYTLRLNSTYVGDDDTVRYVPRTIDSDRASTWSSFDRDLETDMYQQYTMDGFMTLQTLVTRFVNCLPEWDADTKTTTGKCQISQSTANVSNDLDSRLLQTVVNDPALAFGWRYLSESASGSVPSLTESLDNLNEDELSVLIQPLRQAPQPYLGSLVTPFPIETYISSSFYNAVSDVFAIFFILAYLHPLSRILVSLISERETRSRELMKILGVKESSIVVSWYVTYIVILFVGCVLQAIAAKYHLFGSSDIILLFLFFFLFSMSILGFAFMISTMFSKTRSGVYVGFIGFFIMYAVSNAFNDASSESSKNYASILSPVVLVFGVDILADVETSSVGVTFSNASMKVNNFRFSNALWFFAFDAILYTLLGLYFEQVVPKTYGVRQKWYFLFQPSFWRKTIKGARSNRQLRVTERSNDVAVPVNPNIESVSADLQEQEYNGQALCIQGLRKVFPVPGGEKVAVQGLHLNMYTGQISCLLGHNGAGKTTLISMLTGVTEPTSGDATFRGLSLREDIDEIRESLGICFQHDVLYPELTVEDHLDFYARIKGYSGENLEAEVSAKIAEVGLSDKRKTISSALSGGMKRKLSVAISLLGDSSLVFLDEPTSGMDPYSRRSTWDILMNNRYNRVLVLTTHFMDEADILSDRIAIMSEGELRCCGSPLFLKNRYGAGYNLTIVKEEGCDDSKVIEFITRRIPSSRLLSNVGTEVAFQLPLDASPQFPRMFKELDNSLQQLKLLSYGISVTTMEEVFIKVAEAADEHQQHTLQNTVKNHQTNGSTTDNMLADKEAAGTMHPQDQSLSRVGDDSIFFVQMFAMLQKRFRVSKRDKRMVAVGLGLPIAWLVLGLSLLSAGTWNKPDPNMVLEVEGLAREAPTNQVLLPSFCEQSDGDWCSSVLSSNYFSGATPKVLALDDIGNPPYSSDTPTVFNITYDNPSINATDATGYHLKLSEVIYDRAFTKDISDQFGGYLVHADTENNVFGYNVLVNTTLPHGSVVFKALMDQSLYRYLATRHDDSVSASSLSLVVNSHPLPQTATTTALFTSYTSFTACLFITIAFAYYPASIVVTLVKERQQEHNSKHQQLVSGVSITAFWLANYIWDILVYLIPGAAALILIQAYDMGTLTGSSDCITCGDSTFPSVIIIFVLFGFAICPYAYCWSYLFKDPPSSQTYMIMINFVLGVALIVVSFILDVVIDSTQGLNDVLKFIWRLSPLYNLGMGLLNLTIIEIANTGGYESDTPVSTNPFALDNMGYEMIFLVVDAILYFALAIGIDYALTFPKFKAALTKDPQIPVEKQPLDEDVAVEAERVLTGEADSDAIKLQNLRKVYRKGEKVAVQDLSFGLKKGECFGFLGINGAGKTTTMKMLTGDIVPTSGSATLSGFDILTQQIEVRRQIGYCPQFDALIDLLSVREHLELFAQIKGIRKADLDAVVREKMEQLNLMDFEHKLAGSLSGGNKRKLSVAIAMIGSPSILFLDEPSTGMDPVSRRFMWDVISEISTYNKESSVMLTTHSMEECEALCTRVGIMVGGGLKCLGSVQHLKSRFGDGLMFDAKLQVASTEDVTAFTIRHFNSIDTRITAEELLDQCTLLGQPEWYAKIINTHPTGYALANQLHRDGYIMATSFAAWWITEMQFENVFAFLRDSFGSVELLERQNDSCWFKIRGDERLGNGNFTRGNKISPSHQSVLRLSNVFELVENAKSRLAVREYSVSQTTLEQIFNSFASQQHVGEAISNTPTNDAYKRSTSLGGMLL